jgi:hypothetical protein
MPQILQTTLVDNRAVAAAGETFQVDLSVNPLSVILVTFRALNNVLANVVALADWIAKYTNINVRYRGATIIDGALDGIMVGMMMREQFMFAVSQENNVNNDVRSLTIPILFGRKAYDPDECFPATRRGDLILGFTAAADAGGLDGHTIHIETIELLDAQPKQFIKFTETSQAMAGAGANTIDLPIGNKLLGVLLRPFAFPTGAANTSSFGEINLEVDNVEVMYSGIDWNAAHALLSRRLPPWWTWLQHVHPFADAAAGETFTREGNADFALAQQWGLLELDPFNDGGIALDTRGAADVALQMDSDTADGANLSRVYPIELVETGPSQSAA